MPAGLSKPMVLDNALVGNQIQSLDVDGFTVGNDRRVNQAGIGFYWAAFKVDPDMKVGTYTGNGGALSITGLTFSPEYVIVMSSTARRAVQACSAAPAGRSFEFDSAAWLPNEISVARCGWLQRHPNGAAPYTNENGVVYHYVAWNAASLKTFVGPTPATGPTTATSPGWAFSRSTCIIKAIYDNNVLPNLTPPPSQRMAQFVGDATVNFSNGSFATDHIQAFLTDGFQIGAALSINRAFAACNSDGPGCTYFYVAFNLVCPTCPPLAVSEGAGTLTVTASNSFEMTFDTNVAGGAIATFYDLAEDPGRANDLAGSRENSSGPRGLHNFGVQIENPPTVFTNYNAANNISGARLDLLEATATRVRVRPESFYQNFIGGPILAGVKGVGDYSIYGSGRVAVHYERRTTSAVTYANEYSELVVHYQDPVSPPLDSWEIYRELGAGTPIRPSGTGNDVFLMAQNEVAGARTDFLQVLYRAWTVADGYPSDADLTSRSVSGGTERINAYWWDGDPLLLPARSRETWDSLTYFKPTNFASNVDPAVTSRA